MLDAIGGWNEDYPRANDVELSWRAQVRGYTIGFAPTAVVHYRHRSTRRELLRQFYGWGRADAQLFHDFRDHGLVRPASATAWRTWARLVKRLPALWGSELRRSIWLVDVARAAGRLRGSLQLARRTSPERDPTDSTAAHGTPLIWVPGLREPGGGKGTCGGCRA